MGEQKGLIYKLSEINQNNKNQIIDKLINFLEEKDYEVGQGQIEAWKACIDFLIYQSTHLKHDNNPICIFEYFLPLEGGRRPDVIMLFKSKVLVLEFKNKSNFTEDDIMQTIGYREDLINYHKYIRDNDLSVESYLVLTKGSDMGHINSIDILNKENFLEKTNIDNLTALTVESANDFISSQYEPLPNILTATYDLFKKGKLPHIQSIEDGDIQKAYTQLKRISYTNMTKNKGKNIIFISGVPGAGKTLVALKFLYNYNMYIRKNYPNEQGAIYLSGNGPLVNVLQEQINRGMNNSRNGKAYIRGAKDFKDEYMNNTKVPNNNVILFDEAQRAWDADKMSKKGLTEPDVMIDICNKIYEKKKNVTLVCFVGEGQSIHEGEEKGLQLWVESLRKNGGYNIYLPPKFTSEFKNIDGVIEVEDLHLDVSIRNNFIDISKFIEAFLSCEENKARKELDFIKSKGYLIKVSRDFDACKKYVQTLDNKKLKYGALISSKANINAMENFIHQENFESYISPKVAGKWFLEDCENFNIAASEFTCQGLEIDFPVVMFGGDYYIKNNKFILANDNSFKYKVKKYNNPALIMENIYRVLLTRSRKGMILYIPKCDALDETYDFCKKVGIIDLECNFNMEKEPSL